MRGARGNPGPYRDHMPWLLGSLGFSCQRPTKRAVEPDEAVIGQWVAKDWPRQRSTPVSETARISHRLAPSLGDNAAQGRPHLAEGTNGVESFSGGAIVHADQTTGAKPAIYRSLRKRRAGVILVWRAWRWNRSKVKWEMSG